MQKPKQMGNIRELDKLDEASVALNRAVDINQIMQKPIQLDYSQVQGKLNLAIDAFQVHKAVR